MRHVRIQIDAKASYLVYQRGLITEFAKIEKEYDWRAALETARRELRYNINAARAELRKRDKLEQRRDGYILSLLRQKRKKFANLCLESKAPVNKAKHVGVEIEFLSTSSPDDIAEDLALMGLQNYVELKHDGSVSDSGSSENCDGSCRDSCECAFCGDTHYCDSEDECSRRCRNYEGRNVTKWVYKEDCDECDETETLDGCDCGGKDEDGNEICLGEHVVCSGHCEGHYCNGYDDHEDYDCNCECTCSSGKGGHEIAIVAKSSEIAEVLKKVCKVLNDHDAEVNNTCGLHVHIDARGFDEKRMFANLVKSQKLLYSMVPKSRYKNSYCQPNSYGYDMNSYSSRYWGINPKSYKEHETIEVRLHSGTTNATKIINWVKLLQKIAYAKSVKQVNKLSDLTDRVKLSPELIEYINERLERFANEHGGYSLYTVDANSIASIAA